MVILTSFLSYLTFQLFGVENWWKTEPRFDIPYTFAIESCMFHIREPRQVQNWIPLVLQSGNFFNISSLIVDLCMVRFIRHRVLPTNIPLNQIPSGGIRLRTLSGQVEYGKLNKNMFINLSILNFQQIIWKRCLSVRY